MSLNFDYLCDECGEKTESSKMRSFLCSCGGTYRLKQQIQMQAGFKPYYHESFDVQVDTKGQEKRLIRDKGAPLGDYKGKLARMKFIRENKEDIIAERYAAKGLKYPKGKKVRLDEATNTFVPAN